MAGNVRKRIRAGKQEFRKAMGGLATGLLTTVILGSAPGCANSFVSHAGEAPAVSTRMQKPEVAPPAATTSKRVAPGSILDQVSYTMPAPSDCETAARIRATVNGVAILDEEVREAIYPYLLATQTLPEPERSARRKEIFERELQTLIEREVILDDAFARLKGRPQVVEKLKEAAGKEFDKKVRQMRQRANIKTDDEFKAFLRSQGVTMDGIRRQVERNFMATEYMLNRVMPAVDRVSHEAVKEYYDKHPEEFLIADSVTWQDLFVDSSKFPNRDAARQFAEQLVAKARAGEDFLQLVKQFDQGDSSYRKGEGYGHRRGEIKPPEAEPILFQLRDGEVGPVVPIANGFHVLRLVKREYAGRKPFDEKTQSAIRFKLQNEARDREYKRILADLKRKASIEISSGAP